MIIWVLYWGNTEITSIRTIDVFNAVFAGPLITAIEHWGGLKAWVPDGWIDSMWPTKNPNHMSDTHDVSGAGCKNGHRLFLYSQVGLLKDFRDWSPDVSCSSFLKSDVFGIHWWGWMILQDGPSTLGFPCIW